MPKKNKRARFRGVAKQFLSNAVDSSVPNIDSSAGPAFYVNKKTVSEKKLNTSTSDGSCLKDFSSASLDASETSVRYRLIDLQC